MKAALAIPPPRYKSRLEAEYARYLDLRVKAGEVLRWAYEPVTFALGGGARFTPDFRLVVPYNAAAGRAGLAGHCRVELHETKGVWREAAKVRIKVCLLYTSPSPRDRS